MTNLSKMTKFVKSCPTCAPNPLQVYDACGKPLDSIASHSASPQALCITKGGALYAGYPRGEYSLLGRVC